MYASARLSQHAQAEKYGRLNMIHHLQALSINMGRREKVLDRVYVQSVVLFYSIIIIAVISAHPLMDHTSWCRTGLFFIIACR